MCGIGGVIRTKENDGVSDAELMRRALQILRGIENRGRDAAGIGVVKNDGTFATCKAPKAPTEFLEDGAVKAWVAKQKNLRAVFVHARAKTVGVETNNNNNHPVCSENLMVVHNGCLTSFEAVLKSNKLEKLPDTEVDSQLIPILHEEFKSDLSKVTEELYGSYAYAAFDTRTRDFMLVRDNNPLELSYDLASGQVLFASTKEAINFATKDCDVYLDWFYKFRSRVKTVDRTLPKESYIVISWMGVLSEGECEQATYPTTYYGGGNKGYYSYPPSAGQFARDDFWESMGVSVAPQEHVVSGAEPAQLYSPTLGIMVSKADVDEMDWEILLDEYERHIEAVGSYDDDGTNAKFKARRVTSGLGVK